MANSPSRDSMLDRVVRILDAFDATHPTLSVSALSRRADIPQPTMYRLAGEMVRYGLLARGADGDLRLGLRLWELATRGSPGQDLRNAAMPFLQDVQAVVHQHVQLAVLDGDEVLVLERLSMSESVVNQASVAGRLPVHDTSMGMSLMAFSPVHAQEQYLQNHPEAAERFARRRKDIRRTLAEIRRRGYASFDGFQDPDTTGIAVPVLGRTGHAIATIGVVVPTGVGRRHSIIAVLTAAARGIARAAGEGRTIRPEWPEPQIIVQ